LIKTVSFSYTGNQTDDFKSLKIIGVQEKSYTDNSTMPLWGVENLAMKLFDATPLWGLVSDKYTNWPNMSTVRKPALYLPGTVDTTITQAMSTGSHQNLAGNDFYSGAMLDAWSVGGSTIPGDNMVYYTGKSNIAMYAKWQEYSRTPETAAKIINLIWTDVAANGVVGTRGHMVSEPLLELYKREDEANNAAGNMTTFPVTLHRHRIRYHWRYAVPALILFAILSCSILSMFLVCIIGRASPSKIRAFTNSTSAGRLMVNFLYSNEYFSKMSRKQFVRRVGRKKVQIGGHYPVAVDPPDAAPMTVLPASHANSTSHITANPHSSTEPLWPEAKPHLEVQTAYIPHHEPSPASSISNQPAYDDNMLSQEGHIYGPVSTTTAISSNDSHNLSNQYNNPSPAHSYNSNTSFSYTAPPAPPEPRPYDAPTSPILPPAPLSHAHTMPLPQQQSSILPQPQHHAPILPPQQQQNMAIFAPPPTSGGYTSLQQGIDHNTTVLSEYYHGLRGGIRSRGGGNYDRVRSDDDLD
jgi:hypothetical protein